MKAVTQQCATSFLFTRQDDHIAQYQNIVTTYYRQELGIELNNSWNVSSIKRTGNTLVVTQNDSIIGGAILYETDGWQHQLLPLEGGIPLLQKIYDFDLSSIRYGEIGRLAICRQHRSLPLLTSLIERVIQQSIAQGHHFLFVMAPKANAILYRRLCRKIGFEISLKAVPASMVAKAYQHLDMKMLCADLTAFQPQADRRVSDVHRQDDKQPELA